MFGRRNQQAVPTDGEQPQPTTMRAPVNGFFELPTFHGRTRKVTVYSLDSNGKVVKSFRR